MKKLFFLAFLSLSLATKIILPPIKQSQEAKAIIFVPATSFSPDQYISLLKLIQQKSISSLWIGFTDFNLNIPSPLTISTQISDLLLQMKELGMADSTKIYYGGHGLGATILLDHLNDKYFEGIIVLGSFVARKYREITQPEGKSKINFKNQVLTIAAELDGLVRITRIAESFYHSSINILDERKNDFPIAIIKGANHMQFADGTIPDFIKKNDFAPEISTITAHEQISEIMSDFIDKNNNKILSKIKETSIFLDPIIKSLILEGSYHLKDPCYDSSTVNRNVPYCGHGSKMAETAQNIMAGLINYNISTVNLKIDDNFHKVWTFLPDPLPSCDKICKLGEKCELNCVSVTQLIYDNYDDLDTGFYPISAFEMKTKMSSRQKMLEYSGLSNLDFGKTDGGNICKEINENTINWGINNSGKESLDRYLKKGQKLVAGDDIEASNGGLWIFDSMEYNEINDNTMEVKSYSSKYKSDYFLKIIAGFHFCKLLSPAKVIEWIYFDGLKKKGKY